MQEAQEKLLDLSNWASEEAEKTEDAKKKKMLLILVNLLNKILYRLGYRKPRKKKANSGKPPKDAFKIKDLEVEAKKIDNSSAPKNAFKYKDPISSVAEVKEVVNPFKADENAVPKWNKRLNKDKKEKIKELYLKGMSVAAISNELWIAETSIQKEFKSYQSKNIIADNTPKSIKSEFE